MGYVARTLTTTKVLDAVTNDSTKWDGANIDKIPYPIQELRFYSPTAVIQLDAAVATEALPSVVIPALTGLSIEYAFVGIRYGSFSNSAAVGNRIDETTAIQVKESVSGSYLSGLAIVTNDITVAASERLCAMSEIIGSVDVVAQVADFNKTYNFQWLGASVASDSLYFYNFQTLLILGVKVT